MYPEKPPTMFVSIDIHEDKWKESWHFVAQYGDEYDRIILHVERETHKECVREMVRFINREFGEE